MIFTDTHTYVKIHLQYTTTTTTTMSVTENNAKNPIVSSTISFASGAAFGMTSVVTAQPFDTVKTRMQTGKGQPTMYLTATELFKREGIRGLYRGGAPLFIGGAMFRSAQFGCYDVAMKLLGGPVKKNERIFFGALDPNVIMAGFVGGLGRGFVESPFEYAKVRRQVEHPWRLQDVYKGSSITIVRNSFLFLCFVTNIDLLKHFSPIKFGAFWTGAICSNLAWFCVWPLDVVKSRRQSGLYEGISTMKLLQDVIRDGALFKGLIPGLLRSTVANGTGMYMYHQVQKLLTDKFG
jgi:solute carrier family 25 carnitine/acylcarnitine transporter 20/29